MKRNRICIRSVCVLLLSLALVLPARAADGGKEQTPVVQVNLSNLWNASLLRNKGKVEGDKLTIVPIDNPWDKAVAFSREPFRVWNKDGVRVTFRLTMNTTLEGGEYDAAVFFGFTSQDSGSPVQQLENFAGIGLTYSKKSGLFHIGLLRKEANGANNATRGDVRGNAVYYSAPQKLSSPGGNSLDITLTLNGNEISARTSDGLYSEKQPSGLSREFWRQAYLIAQCMNKNDGRGNAVVEVTSLTEAPNPLASLQPLDLRQLANLGYRDETENDRKGGWTDQGHNDLRYLKPGRKYIRNIPFDLIDPDANGGKSCLMLYSMNRDWLPRAIGPLKIGGKADGLLFLHGTAWAKSDAKAIVYRVEYADGSSVDIPMTVGKQIDDWWSMRETEDPAAALLLSVKSDRSARGEVGLYGYHWKNPSPEKEIAALRFVSTEANPVTGVLGVTLVPAGAGQEVEQALADAFAPQAATDYKRNPPDKDKVPDQVVLKSPKRIGEEAFSIGESSYGSGAGKQAYSLSSFYDMIRSFGGISRFPHGLVITFYFWPFQARDWYSALGEKGGQYGVICKWFYKNGKQKCENITSYQQILEDYRRQGLKLILLFNTHSMFDGKDFRYIKTVPEDKMKRQNPLEMGIFHRETLDAIVANNAKLVDCVIENGYEDTVAYWEMDNERWDMKGGEYAEAVAEHVKMLRSKLPKAKVIVCLGELGSYSVNPDGQYMIVWSRELLKGLQERNMAGKIDYFAPHLYPFLDDKAAEVIEDYLQDYCIRNCYRSLDYMSGLLDEYGFKSSNLFVSEWGVQSDRLGAESRNDLLSSMAGGLAAAKTMMTIYSHPRVAGGTWHSLLHSSFVSKSHSLPINKWGGQNAFFTEDNHLIYTPPSEAVKLFVSFCKGKTLVPVDFELPKGIQCLCAQGTEKTYYVVNSTASPVKFPVTGVSKRATISAHGVQESSIVKYGTYGENEGEVRDLSPKEFNDTMLPPYSISIVR